MGEVDVNYATVRFKKKAPVSTWRCVLAEASSLHLWILKYSMMQSGDSNMVTPYSTIETFRHSILNKESLRIN